MWYIELLEKSGLSDLAKIIKNNPDKKPDEFKDDEVISSIKDHFVSLYKSSDDFKNIKTESGIVVAKKIKKALNEKLSLGLSNEEASKIDDDELIEKINSKVSSKPPKVESEKDAIIQTLRDENNSLKLNIESINTEWKSKYDESESRFSRQQEQLEIDKIKNNAISKLKLGDKDQTSNAVDIINLEIQKRGIVLSKDGSVKDKDGNVVKISDNHFIKNVDELVEIISNERKLIVATNQGRQLTGSGISDSALSGLSDEQKQQVSSKLALLEQLNS